MLSFPTAHFSFYFTYFGQTRIEINPGNAEFYYNRGFIQIQLGQKEKGCLDIKKAEKLGWKEATGALKEHWQ